MGSPHSYRARRDSEEAVNGFWRPSIAQVTVGAFILQIELEVVRQQLVLEFPHYEFSLCEPKRLE